MREPREIGPAAGPDALFDRIVTILEEARGNVVRAVNTGMVTAYWLIGREIVEEIQGGEERAEYGKKVIKDLSARLTERYGKGFSVANLKSFRQFYQVYADCERAIGYPRGSQLADDTKRGDLNSDSVPAGIGYPTGSQLARGFLPELSWSHYRALMRVEDPAARAFYEREAAQCGWSKVQLERQIQTSYYQRIVAHHGTPDAGSTDRERLPGEPINAADMLKSPYVLEFLGLPDTPKLHENDFEQAIIENLQAFLLELGKGFAFVARQHHIRFDDEDFYVDLVFYNYILKCFVLIDLKMGRLTLRDVGQMDGYVRLFEDRFKTPGDNPTIGLILCSDKSEAVAKYSVLSEGRQIFASKYLQFLPSEEELQREIQRERRRIERALEEEHHAD
jgi:predicted nuclease of restriction endonuclease-like (RecB) superfamily